MRFETRRQQWCSADGGEGAGPGNRGLTRAACGALRFPAGDGLGRARPTGGRPAGRSSVTVIIPRNRQKWCSWSEPMEAQPWDSRDFCASRCCAAITSPCMPRGLVISATRASRPWRWRAVPWPWGPEPGPDRLRAPPREARNRPMPEGSSGPACGWVGGGGGLGADRREGSPASRSSRGSRGSDGEINARVAKAEDPGLHVHHSAWDAPRSPRSQAPVGWERDCCLEIRSEPASAGPSDSGGVRRISSQQNSMQK